MHNDSNTPALLAAIEQRANLREDGRRTLRCADAFAIAEEMRVPPSVVGRACNTQDVKIVACQLGCFP